MAYYGNPERPHVLGASGWIPDENNAIQTEHIKDGAITPAKLFGGAIDNASLPASFLHVSLLDGQDGDPDTYTLTGIAVGDAIAFVGHFTTKASIASLVDVTADFSVSDADEITDGEGTDYTDDQLMVIWIDLT